MTLDLRIRDHQLEAGDAVRLTRSPNLGGEISPAYLVLHYTAGRNLDSSVAHFMNPAAQASAHLVVGRDGRIVQMVPFNRAAWHAGRSAWKGVQGLNQYSIGIEMDNAGRLVRAGDQYRSWFQGVYAAADVVTARHRHEQADACWHAYTEAQIGTVLDLAALLMREYALKEILGHDDIAPGRKSDPGPAFPMASFRAAVFGRNDDTPERYVVTASRLNLRGGPGRQYAILAQLVHGVKLDMIDLQTQWARVSVTGRGLSGWVSREYIEALE